MRFLRIFKHLLPHGRAWSLTASKSLRAFFSGLSQTAEDIKIYIDKVWLDIFPETTRDLTNWELQFGLQSSGLTEQERRDRIAAAWKTLGGQDPRYIQDTLQSHGFDVYVHEWWEPGSEPAVGAQACATPRNPLLWLRQEFTQLVECGEALAACGEAFAEAGNGLNPIGYPLVNKVLSTVPNFLNLCGENPVEAGEADALCGNYFNFREEYRQYVVPMDPSKWPYFLYIGGETFGQVAQVDPSRKDEFEDLCLKICPAQQWLGMLVEYV